MYRNYLFFLVFILGFSAGALTIVLLDFDRRSLFAEKSEEIDSVYNENIGQRMELEVYKKMAYAEYLKDSAKYVNSKVLSDSAVKYLINRSKFDYSTKLIALYVADHNKNTAKFPSSFPLKEGTYKRVSSGFGFRKHPITKDNKKHLGVDIAATYGTPVYSTADGTVTESNDSSYTGYGKYVLLTHGYGFQSKYAHLSRVLVKPGQKVHQGDVIAFVGNTGLSTGPHLHYEVIKNGNAIDPSPFLTISDRRFLQELKLAKKDVVKVDTTNVKKANKTIENRLKKRTNER